MFMNAFVVGVTIQIVDKVSAAMALIARNVASTQGQVSALNKQLSKVGETFAAGGIMARAGMAILAPLQASVDQAAKLQLAISRVSTVTHASAREMRGFSQQLTDISHMTGVFSKTAVAEFASEMASSGIKTATDIRKLLPSFAISADYLKIVKGADPSTTVHTLAALAHQFGKYSPEEMKPIIQAVTAVAGRLPGGIGGFATMGGYVNPAGSRVQGLNPVDLLALQAAAMQTVGGGGAGARGPMSGAALAALLSRQISGVFGSDKSAFALKVLGFTGKDGLSAITEKDKNGKMVFSLGKSMALIAAAHQKAESMQGQQELARRMLTLAKQMFTDKQYDSFMRSQGTFLNSVLAGKQASGAEFTSKLFAWGLGVTGGRAANILGDPKFMQQYEFLKKEMLKAPPVEVLQAQLMENYSTSVQQLQTDLQTLQATLGMHLLPILTRVVKATDNIVMAVNKFLESHPRLTKFLVLLVGLTGAFMVLAGWGLMIKAAFMGIEFVAPKLLRVLGPIGFAIAALAFVITNWDQILQFLKDHIQQIRFVIAVLMQAFPGLKMAINGLAFVMKNWEPIVRSISKAFHDAETAVRRFLA